jgi:hypothetical protein
MYELRAHPGSSPIFGSLRRKPADSPQLPLAERMPMLAE